MTEQNTQQFGLSGRLTPEALKQLSGTVPRMPQALQEALEMRFEPMDVRNDVQRPIDGWSPKYIRSTSVVNRLNSVLGGAWSFTVGSPEFVPPNNPTHVVVRGMLRVYYEAKSLAMSVDREQYGQALLKPAPGGGYLDIGYDIKAAATDALKKCATLLGVGLEVYEKDESPMQGLRPWSEQPCQSTLPQANPMAPVQEFQYKKLEGYLVGVLGIPMLDWGQKFNWQGPGSITVADFVRIMNGQDAFVNQVATERGKPLPQNIPLKASNA